MTISTHSLFERFLPCAPPTELAEGNVTVFKAESFEVFGTERTFLDVVIRSGERLWSFPFIEYHEEAPHLTYPRSFVTAGAAFVEWLGTSALACYAKARASADVRAAYVFEDDAIERLVKDDGRAAGFAASPGLASYAALHTAFDRYMHAATRAHGRRVLDLRPGVGFGGDLLAPGALCVDGVTASDFHRDQAERLGRRLYATPPQREYDLVLATALDAEDVEGRLEEARRFVAPQGRIMFSVHGDVVERFAPLATKAEILVGPAADYSRRHNETLLWFEPAPVARAFAAEAPAAADRAAAAVRTPLSVLFS
ncbi:MAG: hypothetical protein JO092_08845, partial [Candidatus Eremiobacteraeota bacterium]|nr:hypothetical protein [Candidatus Eremiobacteraeota bacterium]